MRITLAAVIMYSLAVIAPGEAHSPEWLNVCGITADEIDAEILLSGLEACGYVNAGYLWIPDLGSLQDNGGYVVFTGSYDSQEDASNAACRMLWKYPEIYSILFADGSVSAVSTPVPDRIYDLTGLMPPTNDFMHQSIVPETWDTKWRTHGTGEEWEIPVQITSSPPGWIVDNWEDIYAGMIELRGLTAPPDVAGEFARVSEFIRDNVSELEVIVIESPGEYILLHSLPDPADRRGDADFWVSVQGDSLEYGLRVRTFYGEMLYSWMNIPQEARESGIPIVVDSFHTAVDLLLEKLLEDGVYDTAVIENSSFSLEYLDKLPDNAWRDYYDIAIREVHRPGGEGDPDTAPVMNRFRVYTRAGEILWWNPLSGAFMPYRELISFSI